MKWIVLITGLLLCSSFKEPKGDCRLTNGKYRVVYTGWSSELGTGTITITDSTYTWRSRRKFTKGYFKMGENGGYLFTWRSRPKPVRGSLELGGDCEYTFRQTRPRPKTHKPGNGLYMGQPRMRIEKGKLDTFYFREYILDGISGVGIIIKLK